MSDSSNSKSVRKVNPLTIWGVIIIIVLGMVVGFNYVVFKLRAEQ